MNKLRYWISGALYWLADKIEPQEYHFEITHINNKPATAEEIEKLREYLKNS